MPNNMTLPVTQVYLARWKQVSPDGVYTAPSRQMEKVGYAPMVGIRAHIVIGAAEVLGRACTVAIRYSAVRRQFADDDGIPPNADCLLNVLTIKHSG